MASRRLDAKIKQYMRDNPGARYQKARDAVLSTSGAQVPDHLVGLYMRDHPESSASAARTVLGRRYTKRVVLPRLDAIQFTPKAEDAAQAYHLFTLKVGVNDHGTTVETAPLRVEPHTIVTGRAGSGVSTTVASFIMQFLAAGFATYFITADREVFHGEEWMTGYTAGVDSMGHREVMSTVAEILHQRKADRPSGGRDEFIWRLALPPVALVINTTHFTTHVLEWDVVEEITRIGKSLRMHVVLACTPDEGHIPKEVSSQPSNRVMLGGSIVIDPLLPSGSGNVFLKPSHLLEHVRGFVIPSPITPHGAYLRDHSTHQRMLVFEREFQKRMGADVGDSHMPLPEPSTLAGLNLDRDRNVLVKAHTRDEARDAVVTLANSVRAAHDGVHLVIAATSRSEGLDRLSEMDNTHVFYMDNAEGVDAMNSFMDQEMDQRQNAIFAAGGDSSVVPMMCLVMEDVRLWDFSGGYSTRTWSHRALYSTRERIHAAHVMSAVDGVEDVMANARAFGRIVYV